ncbi:MAG: DNA repair protein RecO (recombination protein O) [Bacteroidia bacterium]|jgi:DNA repair protein RecO (recombination protein O)
MPRITDKALVLRRFPFGETSLIMHVLTENHGRVHLVARGAFRAKSPLCGLLDFFDTLELDWTQSQRSTMGEVRSGRLTTRRRSLTKDLTRYRTALAALELASAAAREGLPDPGLYHRLEACFDQLGDPKRDPALELLAFDLDLLVGLGIAPVVEHCAACAGTAAPVDAGGARAAFSAGAGGRLCRKCAIGARAQGGRVGTLGVEVLSAASVLMRRSVQERADLPPMPEELFRGLRDFVDRFLEYHLETKLRSRPLPVAVSQAT